MPEHHEVIVIGGGIAGLKCCEDLNASGVDFLLLEARDRFGGRIYTDRTGKSNYEIGPSWAHDTLMNPLFDEIVKSGDDFGLYYDDQRPYYFGETLEDKDFERFKVEQVVEEMKKYIEIAYFEEIDRKDVPLKQIALDYVYKQRKLLTEDQIKYAPQFIRHLELWHGISWENMSSKFSLVDNVGRNCVLRKGYDQVVNNIVKKLPPKSLVKNAVVRKITRTPHIEIETSDGKLYTSDHLVVAVPQSILQTDSSEEGGIEWTPALPKTIEEPLENMSYGKLGKFVFEFPRSFWSQYDTDRFVAIANPDKEETEQILADLAKDIKPILREKTSSELPKPWDFPVLILNMQKVYGTSVSSLLCFTQGPLTEYLERNPDKAWEYMKPIVSRIADDPSNLPDPENVISSKWTVDPYSRGSYAACAPGNDPTDLIIQLSRGLGAVRFCGEHTILDGAGAVHGAWMSGKREAEHILIRTGRKAGDIEY